MLGFVHDGPVAYAFPFLALVYPTFGKQGATSREEDASKKGKTNPEESRSLDAIISHLQESSEDRSQETFAAAVSLRDATRLGGKTANTP